MVALLSAIGPMIAFWTYGPYPEALFLPLLVGGTGALTGFVASVLIFNHPLKEEMNKIRIKITLKKF